MNKTTLNNLRRQLKNHVKSMKKKSGFFMISATVTEFTAEGINIYDLLGKAKKKER